MTIRPSRRQLMAGGALLVASRAQAAPRPVRPRWKAPNETLAIGFVGVGGKGESNLAGCAHENIVALCDVDGGSRTAKSFQTYERARRYRDFRLMLDKERALDAVVVTTPDHTHAVIALAAMQRGLHVYLEKPLAHSIYETRRLMEAARRYGVATQMGNSGHSSERTRRLCEI